MQNDGELRRAGANQTSITTTLQFNLEIHAKQSDWYLLIPAMEPI